MAKVTVYIMAICAFVCCAGQRDSFACLNSVDKYVISGCGDSDCVVQTCNTGGIGMNLDKIFPDNHGQLAVASLSWLKNQSSVDPNDPKHVRMSNDIKAALPVEWQKQLRILLAAGRLK